MGSTFPKTSTTTLTRLLLGVALLAAACGSSDASSGANIDESGDAVSSQDESVVAPAGSAILPDALCANGAIIDGVLGFDTLRDMGIVEEGATALGEPFLADDWAADPYHSCGATATDGFIDVSITAVPGSQEDPTETLDIGGQAVDLFVDSAGGRIDAIAKLPITAGATGVMDLKITAVAFEEEDLARERVIAIAERVLPSVSVVAPTVADVAAESTLPDPSQIPDDPFAAVDAWKVEQIPGWVADCEGGDLFACDFLWYAAGSDTAEFEVGISCGGTREATWNSRCVEFDLQPITEGDHPLLDELTASCRAGDLDGCFRLRLLVSGASAYYDFAEDCVAQIDDGATECTVEMFADGTGG